ncbi:MAG: lipopolysaccharide biosynthesis protein [Firmicutes bacterium]|nr:lipopolysaccharide biosynthesis protein [Bacillota bacterium]
MRIGIVGCGGIAVTHAKCIKQLAEHELIAFADIKPERAETFAKEYGGNAYSSMEELLEKESPDVIHICTPHYLHTSMAIYGLQHGVHVFMEKPPVINREQWKELKEAALHSDQQLGLCFQNRYNPSILKAKELIGSGETGKVLGARGIVTWNRTKEYYTGSDWRGRLEYEGGGALINQSIHTLDLLHYLVGQKVKSVDAVIGNQHLKGVIEVEDMMSAYIRYPEAVVCFYVTTAYNADSAPLIEVNCENMIIRIEELSVTCYHKDGNVVQLPIEGKKGYGKSYWGAGHEDCIQDFYHSIEQNKSFRLNVSTMEETVLLMLGAYESGRSGQEVSF